MKKFFLFPFRKILRNAKKTNLSPQNNRKHVGKSLFFLVIAVFTIFIFRFVWLITVNRVGNVNLKEAATANYENTITLQATRGTIFDRNGVPLATDTSDYTLYVVLDKNQVDANHNKLYASPSEFPQLTTFLNTKVGIDLTTINNALHSKVNGVPAKQVQFGIKGSHISLQKMQQLQKEADDEKLVGIGFQRNTARSYPMSNTGSGFASQFIGTAQMGSNPAQGLVGDDGLEASFNTILSGQNGVESYQKDHLGRPMPGTTKIIKPVKNGENVYTTLDAQLQTSLETLMDTAASQSGAQQLSATLMTKDGQILATTQRPTYNAQNRNTTASQQPYFTWNNMLFQNAYEPGSTMKTFLMASALNANKVDLNAQYDRTTLQVYDAKISDWDINETGQYEKPTTLTFADGFMMSSNVGMSKVEMNMGYSTWQQYLKRFKFDIKTRTGFDGEQLGSLPAANAVSQVQSAFGQGIGVTEIQMLRGWTAFANGGVMLEPHIVSQVVNPNNNTSLEVKPEVIGNPVSSQSVNQTLNLMLGVDTNANFGTAFSAIGDPDQNIPANSPAIIVNGQPAAVKTGTAQIAAAGGGYMTGLTDNLYSLVAMYPPQNPDYIFYMTVKLPKNGWTLNYIGRVANPLLSQAEKMKSEIFQTNPMAKAGTVTIEDYNGKVPGDTADTLRREILQPVVVGDTSNANSAITAQSLKVGDKVGANTRILLLTNGSPVMPDMYSWTKAQVEQVAAWYNLKITYQGSGNTVVGQSVEAATNIKKGQAITITMGNSSS